MAENSEEQSPLSTSCDEFARAEFEALRAELLALIAESRTLELSALGAAGAIWTWLLTKAEVSPDEFILVAYIPMLLTTLAIIRAVAIYLRIRDIGVYLKTIEEEFYSKCPQLGWERFLPRRRALVAVSSVVFWAVLHASTVFAIVKAHDLAKVYAKEVSEESRPPNTGAAPDANRALRGRRR